MKLGVVLDLLVPLAFPYDADIAPPSCQVSLFLESGLVDLLQCSVEVKQRKPVAVLGKAFETPVP